ncbi:hypothetical protein GE09DRAFT_517357 [Coniochaeta sp. 2T2.1]|nr:hypothetical protein GE09DRAFT_517357 [Coniochaeta sp. 2T2.1]
MLSLAHRRPSMGTWGSQRALLGGPIQDGSCHWMSRRWLLSGMRTAERLQETWKNGNCLLASEFDLFLLSNSCDAGGVVLVMDVVRLKEEELTSVSGSRGWRQGSSTLGNADTWLKLAHQFSEFQGLTNQGHPRPARTGSRRQGVRKRLFVFVALRCESFEENGKRED